MKKYFELKTALDYIELHICDNITQGEIAQAACISVSALQKVFRCTFGYSIKEYIVKRKMTMAAEDVLNGTEGLMEIALRYGYSTLESFSRAFRKVNGVLPSDYRKQGKQTAAFTRLVLNDFGISREAAALVEAIRADTEQYVICFDVVGLHQISALSRQAGDLAILQTLQRIHSYTDTTMQVFCIGDDEFALLTSFARIEQAEQLADAVLRHNGETFIFQGEEIPLYLRCWYGKNTTVWEEPDPVKTLQERVEFTGMMEVQSHENNK